MPKRENTEESDDYEVIPITPIRRLEKRMEEIETSKSVSNFERLMDKIIDMVELNQRIVDEVVKANTGLREDLAVLIGKMDQLQEKMSSFIDIVENAGAEEEEGQAGRSAMKDMVEPLLNEMKSANKELMSRVIESNTAISENLSSIDKRLKRMQIGGGSSFGEAAPATQPYPGQPPMPAQRRM